jgi:hypothetical protein
MSKPISRYEFFRSLARGGLALGATGAGVAALRGSKDPSECMNTGLCESCNVYKACNLPEKKELPHGRAKQV